MLGFCDTRHIVKHHAGLGFHHELGLALAKLHGLTRAARHVAIAASQKDQGADQQQWEQQIAQETKCWRSALGGVHIKADAFFLQGVDQLRS